MLTWMLGFVSCDTMVVYASIGLLPATMSTTDVTRSENAIARAGAAMLSAMRRASNRPAITQHPPHRSWRTRAARA